MLKGLLDLKKASGSFGHKSIEETTGGKRRTTLRGNPDVESRLSKNRYVQSITDDDERPDAV